MRVACTALVFSLLLLQKDPGGDLPLRYSPWAGRLCREHSVLRRLPGTFRWQPDVRWVAESPWASCLVGVGLVLLSVLLESWAASCLTALQTRAPRSPACSETETSNEMDLEIPQRRCSCCLSGRPSTSGFYSYDQASERPRHSFVTFEESGKRRRREVLYSEYKRSRSSSSSTQHSPQDLSSSPSPSPSSSSSSSFPLCLSHLRKLDFLCASGDSSSAKRSLETIVAGIRGPRPQSSGSAESKRSASSSTPPDPSVTEEEEEALGSEAKEKPPPLPGSLLPLEKCSQTESVSLSPQPREIQTQTSFSRLTIIQSSAYKGRILLVERSLQVRMGAVPVPKARPPPLKLILTDDLRKSGKPATLSLMELTSLQHTDKTRKGQLLASLCGPPGPFERAVPKSSPPSRDWSGLNVIFARASSLDEFTRAPSLMEKVDKDTRDLLEFHVKKKMVQWKCGMPSVVAQSVAVFQSLCRDKPASDSRTPTETLTLTSRRCVSLALRISPHGIVGIYSSEHALELKETSALSFWKPEDIRRLAFHTAVKMLEIKMGAFPERVGNSFRLFRGLSRKPLPKVIRSGNKILKAKHPLLPFLAQENVCILDLNLRRKGLAYAGNFSVVYTRVTATVVTSISPRRRASEESRQQMAQLLVSVWRQILGMQILRMQISHLGLSQRPPLPQLLDSSASSPSPPCSAEELPEAPFQGGPLTQLVAHLVPVDTPRPPEEPPLVEGLEKSHQEKPPEPEPGRRAPLLLSFGQPDPKSAASRKAMKFRAEASIVRTSIYLELEVKKEKLNLHLKKRMRASLQMRQGVGLELTVEPRRKGRASPAPRQAPSAPRSPGRPRRSFCYVCMPSDESGTELKTVCWSLPKWILEMNGYRTPEVACFARRSRTPQPVQK